MSGFKNDFSAFVFGYGSTIDLFGTGYSNPVQLGTPGYDQDLRNFASDRAAVNNQIHRSLHGSGRGDIGAGINKVR